MNSGNNRISSEKDEEYAFVASLLKMKGRSPDAVIPILQEVQNRYHYLPESILRRICELSDITPASIAGVSTFYSQFRHRPAGRHTVKVCIGTACHIKGAESVFDGFKQYLNIPEGEDTDADRLFTVEKVACIGCCMLAPAVQIDNLKYGFLDRQKVPAVLSDFLEEQKQEAKKEYSSKLKGATTSAAGEIRLCVCSSCNAAGAGKVYEVFHRQVESLGINASVKAVGCMGISYEAPLVEIAFPDGPVFHYGRVKPGDAASILARHFTPSGLGRRILASGYRMIEKLLTDEAWEPVTRYSVDLDHGSDSLYWGRQEHIVTQFCGSLEPLDFKGYRDCGGFEALKSCLENFTPDEIIKQVEKSGLKGRGGGGYSTAKKWAAVHRAENTNKYIICNGDEGDPGAFMDRMILESFPFRVIEGMAIAAYAVDASEGYLYIRSEYPVATHRVKEALRICAEEKVIGENMMGLGKSFHLHLVEGAGAFVAGEETALIAAIEGRRGMPCYRPPYPSCQGLRNKPTLVNNVETYANVPWIVLNGPEEFAGMGTPGSRGTKTFSLAGKVVRGGLIEVPMGITLREIVEEIGGGVQRGMRLKAVQVGGPSGGCVPASLADTPVDYEALVGAGAIMGSGGLIVLDQTDCIVDIARYFMTFTQNESCGKCTFCRIGTRCMLEILERLCSGEGREGDIEELEYLARIVQRSSLCGLGRTAPNPVLSTLKYFREEYEAHVKGFCPAGKCKDLITYAITDDCIGCTRCVQRCPADAISGDPYMKHEIDPEKCVRCGMCRDACRAGAIMVKQGVHAK